LLLIVKNYKGDTMTEEGKSFGQMIKKAVKIIIGLVVILVGIGLVWWWWPQFAIVVKGMFGVVLALIGLIIVAIGWTD